MNKDGSIKVAGVGTSPPKSWSKTCGKKATLTQWNQVSGADGVTGATGDTGPAGATGVTGITGQTGPSGPTGPAAPISETDTATGTPATGGTVAGTVTCGLGETMTGGGADEVHDTGVLPALVHSYEDPPGTWNAEVVNNGAAGGVTLTIYALCSPQPS